MSNRMDICAPRAKRDGGTYWVKIGTAWANDKGGYQLVFDALPLPDGEGRVVANLFEPRENNSAGGGRRGQRAESAGRRPEPATFDDDIPY